MIKDLKLIMITVFIKQNYCELKYELTDGFPVIVYIYTKELMEFILFSNINIKLCEIVVHNS